ncbi:MAG: hypothetical protein K6T80_07990 [Firmicutes bacterium]|nr:hypothetical protein [Bacillota bacterium]
MYKFKKLLGALLISAMCFTFTGVSSLAATTTDKAATNPYIQLYLDEKKAKVETTKIQPDEYLVDPQVEEQVIISALEEYYNSDKKVATVLAKYVKQRV